MFIPDPNFYTFRIQQQNNRVGGKISRLTGNSFYSHKFHKFHYIEKLIYFLIGTRYREKIWANWQRIILQYFLPKKLSLSFLGIRDPEKTYPGSRGKKGTGSRIPDPQDCF